MTDGSILARFGAKNKRTMNDFIMRNLGCGGFD